MSSYRALVGLDYPPGKRAEPGDVVTDLPGKSAKWLLKQGKIEEISQAASKSSDKKPNGGNK